VLRGYPSSTTDDEVRYGRIETGVILKPPVAKPISEVASNHSGDMEIYYHHGGQSRPNFPDYIVRTFKPHEFIPESFYEASFKQTYRVVDTLKDLECYQRRENKRVSNVTEHNRKYLQVQLLEDHKRAQDLRNPKTPIDGVIAAGELAPPRKNSKSGLPDALAPVTLEQKSKRKGKATPGLPVKRSHKVRIEPAATPADPKGEDPGSQAAGTEAAPTPVKAKAKARRSASVKPKPADTASAGGRVAHACVTPPPRRLTYAHPYMTRSRSSLTIDWSEPEELRVTTPDPPSEPEEVRHVATDMVDSKDHGVRVCTLRQQGGHIEEDREIANFEKFYHNFLDNELSKSLTRVPSREDFLVGSGKPPG